MLILTIISLNVFLIPFFCLSKFELSGSNLEISVVNPKMVRISWISSYLGVRLSGSNCIKNSTPKPKGMEIWLELAGV